MSGILTLKKVSDLVTKFKIIHGNDRQISEIPGRRWKNNYNYRNELIWRGSTSNLAPTDDESEVSSPEDATDYPDALGG